MRHIYDNSAHGTYRGVGCMLWSSVWNTGGTVEARIGVSLFPRGGTGPSYTSERVVAAPCLRRIRFGGVTYLADDAHAKMLRDKKEGHTVAPAAPRVPDQGGAEDKPDTPPIKAPEK